MPRETQLVTEEESNAIVKRAKELVLEMLKQQRKVQTMNHAELVAELSMLAPFLAIL